MRGYGEGLGGSSRKGSPPAFARGSPACCAGHASRHGPEHCCGSGIQLDGPVACPVRPLRDGLRSAALSARVDCFPSTLFSRRVEGKLCDCHRRRTPIPVRAPHCWPVRLLPLMLSIQHRVPLRSLRSNREQGERQSAGRSAKRGPSRSGFTSHDAGRLIPHLICHTISPAAWTVTRGAGRRKAGGSE